MKKVVISEKEVEWMCNSQQMFVVGLEVDNFVAELDAMEGTADVTGKKDKKGSNGSMQLGVNTHAM